MILNFSNLRIFEAVARQQNFSRAAEELAVSQPYVSTQVAELESKLDLILFRRVGRRVYLTDAGNQLYAHAKGLLAQLLLAEEGMAALRSTIAGRLECATTIIPAEHILPPFLESLAEAYPGLQVVLQVSGSKEVETSVLSGRCELGITLSHAIPEGLETTVLGRDELAVVVSAAHHLANKESITPDELAAGTLIVREPGSGTRIFVETVFKRLGLPVRYGPELNNNEVIKALVASKLGIAILSTRTIAGDVQSGRLRALKLKDVKLERPITLIVRDGQALTAAAQTFKSMLVSYCAAHLDKLKEASVTGD